MLIAFNVKRSRRNYQEQHNELIDLSCTTGFATRLKFTADEGLSTSDAGSTMPPSEEASSVLVPSGTSYPKC
jgi:hypothetical protein